MGSCGRVLNRRRTLHDRSVLRSRRVDKEMDDKREEVRAARFLPLV